MTPERWAECIYCGHSSSSLLDLPFFEAHPDGVDEFYCGCKGWD